MRIRPHAVCLVPERREERTTEGGLEVVGDIERLARYVPKLVACGARVSLFIAPDPAQIEAARLVGAAVVELHTGAYADARDPTAELQRLASGAALARAIGLEVHAGHGLTFDNVGRVAALPEIVELNIGHFLIGEAIFTGLKPAIAEMRNRIRAARG